jgi:hypothetical protein
MVTLNEETVKMGAEAGLSVQALYDLADQFRSVYPDNWETLLTDRLLQGKDQAVDKKRIAEKRELVRQLENQWTEIKHNSENLEKDLDKRIADLQKRIGKEESDG